MSTNAGKAAMEAGTSGLQTGVYTSPVQ
jgi:hypothetical protein